MKRQPNRLGEGGVIDRWKPVTFTFDGVPYDGYEGDTLASALLANGVTLVGRSFKYHRPRGVLSAGSEEPNALVELRSGNHREPNTKATMVELFDGLSAASQNRWPSLRLDLMSINSLLSPIFVAGFYYKTFMWPAALWEKLYEPAIRRAAGLGRAAKGEDPDHYEKATTHCDLLIIGGGPAGLNAALNASRSGARVILVDESAELGGRALDDGLPIDGTQPVQWIRSVLAQLEPQSNVVVMRRTTVFGAYDAGTYGALERVSDHLAQSKHGLPRQRLWRIIAKRTILATGATERPIVFGGNDRPGVMLAGAFRTYLNRYAVAPGRRIVVFTNNDSGALTVTEAALAGLEVVAIVDSRRELSSEMSKAATTAGTRMISGGVVVDTSGKTKLSGVIIRTRDGEDVRLSCDCLVISGGWSPNLQLTTHLGGKPTWNDEIAAFVPGTLPPGMSVAGAARGAFGLRSALDEGAKAASEAVASLGLKSGTPTGPRADNQPYGISPLWIVEASRSKALVDFQNDVTASDIALAAREGFRSVEHLKRYTTLGMATDQGRTSNVNALAIMAKVTNRSIPATGMTVARPPYSPVAIGALAGHHRGKSFKAVRKPPSYAWSKANGGVFVETGLWLRPAFFPKSYEKDWFETVCREVKTVRSAVGVCDVSTLGKVDVQGKDAGEFLDKIYMNGLKTLAIGKARYGGMLREDGVFMDDGTIARLGEHHYFVTTTTANAVKAFQHMEFCAQWLWPNLDVQLISATEQWAQYAVAGPKSRELLRKVIDPQFDISDAAFPYLQVGKITVWGGVKGRLFRLSFSGERAYEIAVPARYGDALMRALMDAGQEFGACPYGSEALAVMRIEKGHISGPELNGNTTPRDVGLGGMIAKKKDFIGRVLGERPGLTDPDRPSLVGFRAVDKNTRMRSGSHLVPLSAPATAANDQGYLTSVAYSPTVGHWIALGLLQRGPARMGEKVRAVDPVRNEEYVVEVVNPCFVDPEGEKLRG